jgi:two-component system sensor histidine kinase and response regulator WspE
VKDTRSPDLSRLSLLELFQAEVENQTGVITNGLLALEREPAEAARHLEALMRAAHSVKGAARIVHLDAAVDVAHKMEDCFVAAQQGRVTLTRGGVDLLFRGVDLLMQLAHGQEQDLNTWEAGHGSGIQGFLAELRTLTGGEIPALDNASGNPPPSTVQTAGGSAPRAADPAALVSGRYESPDRFLRLTTENLNRLLGLAGESLVESRWLQPFGDSLQRLKRLQADLAESLDTLRDSLQAARVADRVGPEVAEVAGRIAECREFLSDRLADLDMFDRRSANLSHRLYLEVLQCRMRPFDDAVQAFPRMVRDLARSLGKEVRLEIAGGNTQVDRDILDKLEVPLTHLLRNAVDHGCETPEERSRAGKPAEGIIRLEARHSAGMLLITLSDDGAGVDPGQLRQAVIDRHLVSPDEGRTLSETELLQFLLLPGFTLRQKVTEISGRGVGLDVVHNMVKSVRGTIRMTARRGRGMRFELHLPLTMSVLRALVVEVAGEPYAIPLSRIASTVRLGQHQIEAMQGQHYFTLDGRQVGLLTAHQLMDYDQPPVPAEELAVVVLGDRNSRYGLVVDRFLGERQFVLQPLDSRLGKVRDIAAGSLMEDGSPVLVVDTEDLLASIERLISTGSLDDLRPQPMEIGVTSVKRILAVDDSLTVRELQRKLLSERGYIADVAVDGQDAWNAVRTGHYDLVITDVDMPRMDGIELTALIKRDLRLKSLPVVIVSYKDSEEDRLRGLEAGADYYLTKSSFHDESLLEAVMGLIGGAKA